jgi:hypothetical protein
MDTLVSSLVTVDCVTLLFVDEDKKEPNKVAIIDRFLAEGGSCKLLLLSLLLVVAVIVEVVVVVTGPTA